MIWVASLYLGVWIYMPLGHGRFCAHVQLDTFLWKLAGMVLVWLVPPLCALFVSGLTQLAGVLGWAAMTCAYIPTLRRFGLNHGWAASLPAASVFYTAATLGSALDHYRGRGVVWKRTYHR